MTNDLNGDTLAAFREAGIAARHAELIAPDASTRRYFRLYLASGRSLVGALYPADSEILVACHVRVAHWAQAQQLPTPRLLCWGRRVLLMEDVGKVGLRQALATNKEAASAEVLEALQRFQAAEMGAPNPPFDETLFLRELSQFLDFAGLAKESNPEIFSFCQALSQAVAAHPFRLCHRDFHLDNLLFHGGKVKAVDFQDLRAGPDTYDLVSLLRERGGSWTFAPSFLTEAAKRLALPPGWEDRFWQCAAQRGLKVLGTFLKLTAFGRHGYLEFIPEVARNTAEALTQLGAPAELSQRVADLEVLKSL